MQRVPLIERWERDLRQYSKIGLDTNVVIYALEKREPYDELALRLLSLVESGRIVAVVSPVVEAEVLVKPIQRRDFRSIQRVELFFTRFPNLRIREVDRRVARRAATIRARMLWPLADAIIVATGLEEGCDALVGNDRRLANEALGTPYLYLGHYIV